MPKLPMLKQVLFSACILILLFQLYIPSVLANIHVSAQAAILMDVDSGRILFEKNANEELRIASITKIMTTIIALEEGELRDKVITSKNAAGKEGSSIYLRLGEKLSLEEMLYGLMLRSGNDAAVAIAEHIGGSVEGFVFLMNQKAAELGMMNTRFNNPHGLDDHEEHYSTARDMAILTAYALKNKDFAKIAKTKRKTAQLPGEKWDRVWHNKNKLLSMYPYADGVKTGFTKRAKRTLVSSATKDGHQLVAVTLNAPNDWQDHIDMFEYAFGQFKQEILIKEKEVITDERLQRNDGFFQASRTFSYPLMKQERVKRKIILAAHFEQEQIELGSIVYPAGYIIFTLDDKELGKIPLKFVHHKQETTSLWHSFIFILERMVEGV